MGYDLNELITIATWLQRRTDDAWLDVAQAWSKKNPPGTLLYHRHMAVRVLGQAYTHAKDFVLVDVQPLTQIACKLCVPVTDLYVAESEAEAKVFAEQEQLAKELVAEIIAEEQASAGG